MKFTSLDQVRPRTSLYFSLINQELQEGIVRKAERDFHLFEPRKGCVAFAENTHLSPSTTEVGKNSMSPNVISMYSFTDDDDILTQGLDFHRVASFVIISD